MEKIIPPISQELLEQDVARLGASNKLVSRNEFDVYVASFCDIPNIIQEIGRLREITFRATGEGTGKEADIDTYDEYYQNLFIWDNEKKAIVGGYRIGMGEQLMQLNGMASFYIDSLFEIDPEFTKYLSNSIELGRSYLIENYQKAIFPLFLLWKGIVTLLSRHKQYRYLIGPVSISKYYSEVSKSLIVAFVKKHYYNDELAALIRPRTPYKPVLEKVTITEMMGSINSDEFKSLELFINQIEPNHIKLPVLLKQYAKLNARFISFNLDPNFSDALDGLMLLDLHHLPEDTLELLNYK